MQTKNLIKHPDLFVHGHVLFVCMSVFVCVCLPVHIDKFFYYNIMICCVNVSYCEIIAITTISRNVSSKTG